MNNLFVNPEENIAVEIFVATSKGKIIAESTEKALKSENKEIDPESIESYQITFRRPSYKDNVDIMKLTMTTDGEGIKADIATLRYERFVGLIKEWSFKDESGSSIPATRENIDKLQGAVANAVMNALDEALDTMQFIEIKQKETVQKNVTVNSGQ